MNDKRMMIEAAKKRASENYSSGYNCAESVFDAALAAVNSDLPTSLRKLATGFGGGIGKFGDTCGALTGAVLAVGTVHGREGLPERQDLHETIAASKHQLLVDPGLYRIFNQIPNWFRGKHGHTLCRELTAPWESDWHCRERAMLCRQLIAETAGFAVHLMLLSESELRKLEFADTVDHA